MAQDAARVRAFYDWASAYRRRLDAPDILIGNRVYDTMQQYDRRLLNEEIDIWRRLLSERARAAFDSATQVYGEAYDEVEGGQNADDNQWKSEKLDELKRKLDAFLATDPDPAPVDAAMSGGKKKRRKTRRRRYSRRC
jgi:hypothetical protein